MLIALLKGKLSREQENMEDILTSNVFGLLKYLPAEVALLPFLRLSETPEGKRPLDDLPDGTAVDYEFWPQWHKPGCAFCEPDVVLRLVLPNGSKRLVLVEAKFRSAKSAKPSDEEQVRPNDQLSKEWANLRIYAQEQDADPILIYLTADMGCPSETIEASRAEHRSKRSGEATITWLSWRNLEATLTGRTDAVLRDLGDMLRKLGLVFFRGFSQFPPPPHLPWRFLPSGFDWEIALIPGVQWRFRPPSGIYN